MIISGEEIKKRIGKEILIEPFDPARINPNSYNLKLHNELLVYDEEVLDMKKDNSSQRIVIPAEGLVLNPEKVYLGRIKEHIEVKSLVPFLEGRSSIGRLGLHVHVTAGLGQVGSKGYWTLELHAVQPIRIYADIEICQIYFLEIKGDYLNYSNKYFDSKDIQTSFLYKELD
jgi:dCTP deaminase